MTAGGTAGDEAAMRSRSLTARRSRTRLRRAPQLLSPFEPGNPLAGYYNDLTLEVRAADPLEAGERLRRLVADPHVNWTNVAQLGIGAWQLARNDSRWLEVSIAAARWLAGQLDDRGRLVVRWAMPHTYELKPPWISAMTQAEAVSLFVRAAPEDDGPEDLFAAAARAIAPLFDPSPVVSRTPEGPVLQEYPTSPPAHVLNGWIFGLWGLYDVAAMGERGLMPADVAARAASAFDEGISALAARLPYYDAWGWSRYDLFPHPIAHVASPFYHRLHIEQLRATNELTPDPRFEEMVARWERSTENPVTQAAAVARKMVFRTIRPRHRRRPGRRDA
jgi:heparosan-N-sulfate-glucuronate 5-epimerase